MGRRLNTTVQAGRFVFPEGTDEADIAADIAAGISPALWEGDGASVAVTVTDSSGVQQALAAATQTIDELRARVVELEAELAAERSRTPQPDGGDEDGDGGEPAGGAYDGLDVEALKAVIEERNEGREQDDRISKRGGVETLVAALVADDQAQA